MNIAIIGTGNVGAALAEAWAKAGHTIRLGVRNTADFKGRALLDKSAAITVYPIGEAVAAADVVLIAAVPQATQSIAEALGDVSQKVIIDAMNGLRARPEPFSHTTEALQHWTNCPDIVKCFNSTGAENMHDPNYGGVHIDMFMAGSSAKGKAIAQQLALDAGFAECYDFGGDDKVPLLEQFAFVWINLAIMQGQGRAMAFKLLKR
ncbi:NADPH-dependent F420 reductase [Fibrella aquatilis]|uniref:NAD(P)-binding domain-containing protein n=1 Tax=Fibrella aquatilis TaxID=2817059 RepID=A0A939JV32_9BACT|nr:NAD(P)-binding domain-containing protein [Fibrella aquatilis]MBO0930427.1 NAD(P)-binding domain-containing protein [Fibrella aquatilis]